MKNTLTVTGTLRVIERMPNSYNGNPRYLVTVGCWTCRTVPDSSFGYVVRNLEGKEVSATIGYRYGKLHIANATPV